VARENLALSNELFCKAVAERLLGSYPQLSAATVTGDETKWTRLVFGGKEHPHSFVLDGNGEPFAEVAATRDAVKITSGVKNFTFMKTTQSGWDNFFNDQYTTIPPTRDRMAATSMLASWRWSEAPQDYAAANTTILSTMVEVFANTYSESIQDSLYRMGGAALAAVPQIIDVRMACPNRHYLLINLTPFQLDNKNQVFLPTDEPHGQIECTVER
jgi:urate oxidase